MSHSIVGIATEFFAIDSAANSDGRLAEIAPAQFVDGTFLVEQVGTVTFRRQVEGILADVEVHEAGFWGSPPAGRKYADLTDPSSFKLIVLIHGWPDVSRVEPQLFVRTESL